MDEREKQIATWSSEANAREHARFERRREKVIRWTYRALAVVALLKLIAWLFG